MSFESEMDPLIGVYTPCLIDSLEGCLDDYTLFADQPKQVIKSTSLSESSEYSMSTIDCETDPLIGDISSSDRGFSPNHSLISEDDDIDFLSFLVKDNDESTAGITNAASHLSSKIDFSSSERNRKNAIAAKENRQKKKKYVEGLETDNETLSAENEKLKRQSCELKRKVDCLEEEVLYLKSVLAHQSALSKLLKNIGKTDVKLSTSFEMKESSEPRSKRRRTVNTSATSGGVCLHVRNDNVSLEFCSTCAAMAKGQGR